MINDNIQTGSTERILYNTDVYKMLMISLGVGRYVNCSKQLEN